MGNFSRNTFDALKHYVGVRLQQGVPLVDADWNELEDIRRFELQAFLKWFVGDGVPAGNDGFRIALVANKMIFTSKKAELEIDFSLAIVGQMMGLNPGNRRAARCAPPAPQLIGSIVCASFDFGSQTLTAKTRNHPDEAWTVESVTFSGAPTKERALATINAMQNITAAIGAPDDFVIKGGDGTPGGAGRCLVDGWDVINESSLTYTAQPLYNDSTRAALWGVDPLLPLNAASNRTDLVYLDVWEREVVGDDDRAHMINPVIGVETCVRIKREWVVRVAEGVAEDTKAVPQNLRRARHAYYPLARLHRKAGQASIDTIDDLRRSGLGVLSEALTIKDGKVGIGTKDPAAGLEINCGDTNDLALLLNSSGPGWGSGLQFKNTASEGKSYGIYSGWGTLHFADTDNQVDRLIIDRTGNVGIGTVTPRAKLEITAKNDTDIVCGLLSVAADASGQNLPVVLGKGRYGGYIRAYTYQDQMYTFGLMVESAGFGDGDTFGIRVGAAGTGNGTKYGIYASASPGPDRKAYAGYFAGDVEVQDNLTVQGALVLSRFIKSGGGQEGNIHIVGNLTKDSGGFLIDHPLDPLNMTLRHNFVESPENLCVYRGAAHLDADGKVTIHMPRYFEALTREEEATVYLTAIGQEPFMASYTWEETYNTFTIFGPANRDVAYIVLGARDDPVIHLIDRPVEEEKGNGHLKKGRMIRPDAYGFPLDLSIVQESI